MRTALFTLVEFYACTCTCHFWELMLYVTLALSVNVFNNRSTVAEVNCNYSRMSKEPHEAFDTFTITVLCTVLILILIIDYYFIPRIKNVDPIWQRQAMMSPQACVLLFFLLIAITNFHHIRCVYQPWAMHANTNVYAIDLDWSLQQHMDSLLKYWQLDITEEVGMQWGAERKRGEGWGGQSFWFVHTLILTWGTINTMSNLPALQPSQCKWPRPVRQTRCAQTLTRDE